MIGCCTPVLLCTSWLSITAQVVYRSEEIPTATELQAASDQAYALMLATPWSIFGPGRPVHHGLIGLTGVGNSLASDQTAYPFLVSQDPDPILRCPTGVYATVGEEQLIDNRLSPVNVRASADKILIIGGGDMFCLEDYDDLFDASGRPRACYNYREATVGIGAELEVLAPRAGRGTSFFDRQAYGTSVSQNCGNRPCDNPFP